MVFIEFRSSYLKLFEESPGMTNVIDFILNRDSSFVSNSEDNGIEPSVNTLIRAISNRDSNSFAQIEDLYKRKKPDANSPWINNNYLIFLLLIGQRVFKKDGSWLKAAIGVRVKNDDESELILDFFNGILSNSSFQTGPKSPLFLAYLYLTNPVEILNGMVNEAMVELCKIRSFPYFKNEFLNILYLCAFQAIVLLKDIANVNFEVKVKRFKLKSDRRLSMLANVFLYFLLGLFLIGIFFFTKYVFLSLSETWRNSIVTVLGLVGITFFELFKGRLIVKKLIEDRIRAFFGLQILDDVE